MKVDRRTLREIFDFTERLEAPLFQRPYVWKKEKNWQPLWEAIQNVADSLIERRESKPHFLGAIVLDQLPTPTGTVAARQIIDGQQRLIALQLALAAVRDCCRSVKQDAFEQQFKKLTVNSVPLSKNADDIFKVWPTNSDRVIFKAVMTADSAAQVRRIVDESKGQDEPLIPDTYLYFFERFKAWLGTNTGDSFLSRLDILRETFEKYIILVVIDLGNDDDPQEIFETLNARGTPLLPADLVKNFLFHRAEKEDADLEQLHRCYWEHFDTHKGYWRKDIGQGRVKRPRLDWFLQYYLTLMTRAEVLATELFLIFRNYVGQNQASTQHYLRQFQEYSDIYKSFDLFPLDSPEGLFFYRLRQLETTTLFPLLLEIFRTHSSPEKRTDRLMILRDLESFLVRRQICQLTTKNYNRFFLDVIQQLQRQDTFDATDIRTILLQETADTSRWPTDAEFGRAWLTTGLYKKVGASRLRMILEALDAALQSDKSEKIEIKEKLTIEHIMPQDWETNWPLATEIDLNRAKDTRNRMVHTIGNLTLLTKALNPSVSNGAWNLKRKKIAAHSAIAMNRQFYEIEEWNETEIFERTKNLLRLAVKLWPRPDAGDAALPEMMSLDLNTFSRTWDLSGSEIDTDKNAQTVKLKLRDLFNVGVVRPGDRLTIRNRSNSEAIAIDDISVRIAATDEVMTWNEYGQRFTGHVAVNIYKHVEVNGVLLGRLRSPVNQERVDLLSSFPPSET